MIFLYYVLLFLVAFVLGFFNISPWITGIILFCGFYILLLQRNPLLFGKDTEKMVLYLKNSKQAYLQFLYHIFHDDLESAERPLMKVKSKVHRRIGEVMIFSKQKRYDEAKQAISEMKDNYVKWYYRAAIALEERDYDTYRECLPKINNETYRILIEAEEKRTYGHIEEALKIVKLQIPKLRGIKLLSAVHYLDELEKEKIH
ncbi:MULTISPECIES: hypothetical protein [unclassified Bacillus (in: firmicutes)]|uniref:hypothetical protein n=1 Tax=unclassified Bacillus (in: firmicutes) TaxID=185979 RepID=UPI0008DF1795|nr:MULTISPECIES: hypothetical protein [unclassified Bacillus (in: firmicutes)]SFA87006.1 hypothetical protein SAMN02799634_102187 [Bacillus sp. UNCCL13]SFQ84008.1 hypothetical protein SAMN04488577_2307 [Bacillus sp. cl95]